MATREAVQDDYNFASDKLSELTRLISLSVLALVWLFIAGGDDAPNLPAQPNQSLLLVTGALVLLSLLADYFQYVAGYVNSKMLLEVADATGATDLKYNDKGFAYRTRRKLFVLRQVFAVAAVLTLVTAVVIPLLCICG